MVKPANFSESKKYPVLMIQYSGPNSQQVLDSYGFDWEHYLAAKGILVVCVDGRATGARGEAFRKCDYMKMGVIESQDQVEAAQALGKLPYVDKDRIAIWGWSFGGYNTLMAMSVGNGTFKAGIAVAPPTDWKFYDSIYTERYMRTPKENPQGYAETSPLKRAKDLQGKLLIVHGTADDNVHFQQTMDYVEELVQANKQFEMQVYKDRNHSIYGGNTRFHLYTRMYDSSMPADFLTFICNAFNIEKDDLVMGGRYNNLQDLSKLPNPRGKGLEQTVPSPMRVPFLDEMGSVFRAVKKRDILLHFPYQSFDYLIRFLMEAAFDPKVEEIKITQYRVAENSAVINTLISAAQNGKKVTVFVELKARFDEENNMIPRSFLIDKSGKVIYSSIGFTPEDFNKLMKQIEKALK